MKKLLIISYSFPPSNVPAAQRPYFFYKYLKRISLVVTSSNANSFHGTGNWAAADDENIYRTSEKSSINGKTGGIQGNKTGWKYRLARELLIPDKGIFWFFKGYKLGKKVLEDNPKVKWIYSTSPSVVNHFISLRLAKKFNKKVIADFRDLYYIKTIEDSDLKLRPFIDRRLEKFIVTKADKLIFVSPQVKELYCRKYSTIAEKSSVIYNGFEPDEYFQGQSPATDKMNITYAGSFYNGERSPFPLLALLDDLARDEEIDLDNIKINIAGNIGQNLVEEMQKFHSFKCVSLMGVISRVEVLNLFKRSDVLWQIIGEKDNHKYGVPIKTFEYLGTGKHVLMFSPNDSECYQICSKFEWFTILEYGNDANRSKLHRLYADYISGDLKSGPVDLGHLKIYTREFQADQLLKLLD